MRQLRLLQLNSTSWNCYYSRTAGTTSAIQHLEPLLHPRRSIASISGRSPSNDQRCYPEASSGSKTDIFVTEGLESNVYFQACTRTAQPQSALSTMVREPNSMGKVSRKSPLFDMERGTVRPARSVKDFGRLHAVRYYRSSEFPWRIDNDKLRRLFESPSSPARSGFRACDE